MAEGTCSFILAPQTPCLCSCAYAEILLTLMNICHSVATCVIDVCYASNPAVTNCAKYCLYFIIVLIGLKGIFVIG